MSPQVGPLFLSTAIPYVNAEPHVGHAFELLLADALARHFRQLGLTVRLTGGTDDHSLKNARAAALRGLPTRVLVAQNGASFRRLGQALGVSFDDYLHTSSDSRHAPAVRELWRRCQTAGDLYQKSYRGLYCNGCEAFLQEQELSHGGCALHPGPLEEVDERNWFFRLSRHQPALCKLLETGELRVWPQERHNEVTRFVSAGLQDFSVSRSSERARGWGIAVPGDDSQVIYVWFDALANYLAQVGFPDRSELERRYFSQPARREHLIGKDILRFHAVYWPAILLSAGLPAPSAVRSHGFVTLEGDKIGKSSGNALDPFALLQRFGLSAVRYYFLRHLHTTKDSDLRVARLVEAHDSELAGKLGNLLQRTTALALRHPELSLRAGTASESDADRALAEAAARARADVTAAVCDFALTHALSAVLDLVAAANRYADAQQPWELSKRARLAHVPELRADLLAQLAHVLWRLLEALRVTAVLLAPFLPDAAAGIAERIGSPREQLDDWQRARFGEGGRFRPRPGAPLFPRLTAS